MLTGIAIGTFIGVLIGINHKAIEGIVIGLIKLTFKGVFYVGAVYGVGSILLSVI